ncbi:MAG: beta-lactamase family protein [Acidobacteriota bacterium]|nr:beta-lactamase family protein [Acidobacteriota bacterium]
MNRILIASALGIALVLSNLVAAFAQTTSANQPQKAIDRKELETFLDKFFAEQMPKYKVPGAVFVMVKDGEVFFAKGFGYADVEKKKPVDPNKTLFRAYSISKSFTATAVMQLVERGELKLDEDVNKYLKRFKIKDNFTEPITLADLLTHRAGFTDTAVEMQLAQGKYRVLDLGEYLKQNLPPRSRPPGKFEYSNFGSAMAGLVVEEVSGEPFASYIENHILKPLDMRRSTFLLPSQLPAQRAADFAASYAIENGVSRKMKIDEGDFSVAPAANLLTTGNDMARFMIAHLQNGSYKNTRILSEASAKKMHEPRLSTNLTKDFGYGFFWRTEKGQRVMFHAGGYQFGNVNLMQLIPEQKAGFFLSFTHGGIEEKRDMRAALASQFMARYFSEK